MSTLGRHEDAIREIKIARNLDPLAPRISSNVGDILYNARRYDQAIKELNTALEVDPNHATAYWFQGWAYEAMGKYEDAIKSYLRTFELMGERRDINLGIAGCYALMGKREEAQKILNNAVAAERSEYISAEAIAEVFAVLGEKDQTFDWLEKAFQERDPALINYLKNVHRFDAVRSDPRFTNLLRRIGLEK
jgi:tetratricopeptide (TPR) repeat protein